jgi:hypothetical protein
MGDPTTGTADEAGGGRPPKRLNRQKLAAAKLRAAVRERIAELKRQATEAGDREGQRISMEVVAARLEVVPSFLSAVLVGDRRPPEGFLPRLAEALGWPPGKAARLQTLSDAMAGRQVLQVDSGHLGERDRIMLARVARAAKANDRRLLDELCRATGAVWPVLEDGAA